ncbi:MAG: hypothetical protein ACOVNU_09910 [Candidatus Kapaibacteriota bacterium]
MNKIQRAIQDVKMEVKRMQNVKVSIEARLEAYLEQLDSLESINNDNSIPHSEDAREVTKEEILKRRSEEWADYNHCNYDIDNEALFSDGFTRGSIWMKEQIKKQ